MTPFRKALAWTLICLGLGFGAVALSAALGCSTCKEVAHRNDLSCAIVNDVVDCTDPGTVQLVNEFVPFVKILISGLADPDGTVNWLAIENGLVGLGIKDGGCILESVVQDLTSRPQAGMRGMRLTATYEDNLATYRAKHWPRVKFKMPNGALL